MDQAELNTLADSFEIWSLQIKEALDHAYEHIRQRKFVEAYQMMAHVKAQTGRVFERVAELLP